jgi:hypothetical protein
VEPLLILVKLSQISSLDPQKYLVVILFVILVVANDGSPIFSGRPRTCVLRLLLNQYFVIVVESMDARCAVIVVAVLIDRV